MVFEMFDKILLKTGEIAYLVEIFDNGKAFIADINKPDGKIETDFIRPDQIEKKL